MNSLQDKKTEIKCTYINDICSATKDAANLSLSDFHVGVALQDKKTEIMWALNFIVKKRKLKKCQH